MFSIPQTIILRCGVRDMTTTSTKRMLSMSNHFKSSQKTSKNTKVKTISPHYNQRIVKEKTIMTAYGTPRTPIVSCMTPIVVSRRLLSSLPANCVQQGQNVGIINNIKNHKMLKKLTRVYNDGMKQKIIIGTATTATTMTIAVTNLDPNTLTTPTIPTTILITPNSIPNMHESPYQEEIDDIETVEEFYAHFEDQGDKNGQNDQSHQNDPKSDQNIKKKPTPEQIFPNLPIYSLSMITHASSIISPSSDRVIIVQGDYVYDVTEFIETHPGGDKILQANKATADPFWILYPIHLQSAIVWQVLNQYRIGILDIKDREEQAEKIKILREEARKNNMWKYEPLRDGEERKKNQKNPKNPKNQKLRFLSKQPCNAEAALHLIPDRFITPNDYWFIRNHHPAPVCPRDWEGMFEELNGKETESKLQDSQNEDLQNNEKSEKKEKSENNHDDEKKYQEKKDEESKAIVENQYGINVDKITNTWFLPIEERYKYPISIEIDKELYENGTFKGQTDIEIPIFSTESSSSSSSLLEPEMKQFTLNFNAKTNKYNVIMTIGDLESLLPQDTVISTIICSGNRRNEMNVQTSLKTDGLSWGHGALSTGSFEGFKLSNLYSLFGINYLTLPSQPPTPSSHCVIRALDAPFDTSIPLPRVLDPQKDVLLALSMNNTPLSPDQGYPLKLVVPGCTGNRHVKWVSGLSIGFEEATSPWHSSTPYRLTGPATQSGRPPNESPPVYFWPIFSSITSPVGSDELIGHGRDLKNGSSDEDGEMDQNVHNVRKMDATTLNPSQELIPTPATAHPHQCRDAKTIGSLKAQLLRQPGLANGGITAHGGKMTDKDIESYIASTFRCIDVSGYAYVGNGIGIARVDTAVVGVVGYGDENKDKNDENKDKNDENKDKNDEKPSLITSSSSPSQQNITKKSFDDKKPHMLSSKEMIWSEASIQRGPDEKDCDEVSQAAIDEYNKKKVHNIPDSTSAVGNRHWAWVLWKSEVVLPASYVPGSNSNDHNTSSLSDNAASLSPSTSPPSPPSSSSSTTPSPSLQKLQKGDVIVVSSKAVDFMANSQPQFIEPMWNNRGILDNAWCQYPIIIGDEEKDCV